MLRKWGDGAVPHTRQDSDNLSPWQGEIERGWAVHLVCRVAAGERGCAHRVRVCLLGELWRSMFQLYYDIRTEALAQTLT